MRRRSRRVSRRRRGYVTRSPKSSRRRRRGTRLSRYGSSRGGIRL